MRDGQMHKTHGEAGRKWTPEYRAWVNMNTRCHNPNSTRYSLWGGRGIRVHEPWRDDFTAFLAYVGRRPSDQHSLDRYPNRDGHYEPGNVRWATRREQARNTKSNRRISAFGKTMTVVEWAETMGIKAQRIIDRLNRGWDAERAVGQ